MSVVERVLSHPLSEIVGWSLVHFIWQGTVLALVVAIAIRGLRRSSASVRYLTACATLAMMAVCPVLTAGWLARTLDWPADIANSNDSETVVVSDGAATEHDISPATSHAGWHVQSAAMGEATGVMSPREIEPAAINQGVPPERPLRERVVTAMKPVLPWMVGVWLVGVSLLSGRLLLGWVEVQRLRRSAIQPVGESCLEMLRQLAAQLRVSRPVRLVESALVEVPTVVGWLRPMILLPASAITGLTGDQLQAVLAHELAHIRRHDYLVNLLQTVAETLLFYHPAVWWVSHRIRLEREHCCDDIAVQICGDRVAYARMLVTLEALRTPVRLAMTASGGSLLNRISRLLGSRTTPHTNRSTWWLASVLVMTTVAALGLGLYMKSCADEPTLGERRGQENLAEQKNVAAEAAAEKAAWDELDAMHLNIYGEAAHQRHLSRHLRQLEKANFPEKGLQEIRRQLQLPIRDAEFWIVPAKAWPHVGRLVSLQQLRIVGSDLHGKPMEEIGGLRELRRFEVATSKFQPQDLASLRRLTELEHLEVTFTVFDDTNAKRQEQLGELSEAEQDLVQHLKTVHPDREHIWQAAILTDRALEQLGDLKRLRTVKLINTFISSRGFRVLSMLPALEELEVGVVDESPEVVRLVGAMKSLKRLKGLSLTDDALAEWTALTQLEELGLYAGGVTDQGVEHLTKISQLRRLVLWHSQLTDAGLLRLAELPHLESLDVRFSKSLSQAGVEQFQQRKPKCKIVFDRAALDQTAGLPNSDDETNPPNNANGDLRSNPAAGSGDPRRAQNGKQEVAGTKLSLRITGRVVDAKSGKAIDNIRMVPTSVDGDDTKNITWQSQYLKDFTDGRFLYETDRPLDKTRLRIEAAGYRPAITRVVNKGEVVELEIKLERQILAGVVRLPNGQPAVKAQVALASWTNEVNLHGGKLSYGHHGEKLGKLVETDEQGRFVMPAEIDPSVLVVAHAEGYAERANAETTLARTKPMGSAEADDKPAEDTAVIELQPWGRVEGRVLMGDKPVVGAKYHVYQSRADDVHVQAGKSIETDAEGRFVVEQLPPGKYGTCQRYASSKDGKTNMAIDGLIVRFEIPSGRTTTLALGSPGRTLIGKLALPAGFPHKVDWANAKLIVSLQAQHSHRWGDTSDVFEWSKFMQTDEGKLYGRDNVAIAADGSFRIEGLPPAEYELNAIAETVVGDAKPAEEFVSGKKRFSVPGDASPDKVQTIDLGTIDLKPLVTRAGRESPDPALDPTAGFPNSDEETNPPNNAKGDLRSKPAAESGDPRRAQSQIEKPMPWTSRRPDAVKPSSKETAEILDDGSVQMSLPSPNSSNPQLRFQFKDETSIDSVRLEVLPDRRFADRRLGRIAGRELLLFEFKPHVLSADGKLRSLEWKECRSLQDAEDDSVAHLIDYATDTGWKVPPLKAGQTAQELVFQMKEPLVLKPGDALLVDVDSGGSESLDTLARFRVSFPNKMLPQTRPQTELGSGKNDGGEPEHHEHHHHHGEQTQLKENWGPEHHGLRTRLIVAPTKLSLGWPFRATCEVKNVGSVARTINPQGADYHRGLEVIGPDGKLCEFLHGPVSTVANDIEIKPGESRKLFENIDISSLFLIPSAGEYTLRLNGGDKAKVGAIDDGRAPIPPPSDVKVTLKAGELPPIQTLFLKLRPLAPKDWSVYLRGQTMHFTGPGPGKLAPVGTEPTAVQLWFAKTEFSEADQKARAAQHPNEKFPQLTRLGMTPFGFGHLSATGPALKNWPQCIEAIRKVAVVKLPVEVRLVGGPKAEPLSNVKVEFTTGHGSDRLSFGTFTTDEAGWLKTTLPDGFYYLHLKSEKEWPYLTFEKSWTGSSGGHSRELNVYVTDKDADADGSSRTRKSSDRSLTTSATESSARALRVEKWLNGKRRDNGVEPATNEHPARITFTLEPAVELVLRAVDIETGKGIVGTDFYEEVAAGEDWAHSVYGQNLGRKFAYDSNAEREPMSLTDNDGYLRRWVGEKGEESKFGVWKAPTGYELVEPKAELSVLTELGQARAEQVFKFRRIRWAVRVEPEKKKVTLGEPLTLRFFVKNATNEPRGLELGGDYRNRLGRPESFEVTVINNEAKKMPVPDAGPTRGGESSNVLLKPDGEAKVELKLSDWATITQPGNYRVFVKRTLKLFPIKAQQGDRIEWGDQPEVAKVAAACEFDVIAPAAAVIDANSEPNAKGKQSSPQPTTSPPVGLEFLKPYPKLHRLSLDMTEPQFWEIVKQQELKTRKVVYGEKVTHHIALGDGHTLIVMFDKDAKCSGIQRVRGEDEEPARQSTSAENGDQPDEAVLKSLDSAPMSECRALLKRLDEAGKLKLAAMARERLAKRWKSISEQPVASFLRELPKPDPNLVGDDRGPLVGVQTDLDGVWSNGKGTADNWKDWIVRKQNDYRVGRLHMLFDAAAGYRNVDDAASAKRVLQAGLTGHEIYDADLKTLLGKYWPVTNDEPAKSLDPNSEPVAWTLANYLGELSSAQQKLGEADAVIVTHSRLTLAHFMLSWKHPSGGPTKHARELWALIRQQPKPTQPLFWFNVVDELQPKRAFDLSSAGQKGRPLTYHHENLAVLAPHEFASLTITAETRGQKGLLDCYRINAAGKHQTIGLLQPAADGAAQQTLTKTFKVPAGTSLVQFMVAGEEFQVGKVTVEATFTKQADDRGRVAPQLDDESRSDSSTTQPQSKESRALFQKWQRGARGNGAIPGGTLGALVRVMRNFVKNNPTHEGAPKFMELLKRIDVTRDWSRDEAVKLLDEVSAIYPSLPEWVEGESRFRLGSDVVVGKPLPEELKDAPWGKAQPNGLRVAWLLEPRGAEHRLNTPLRSRVLFHNSGKNSVVFRALTWNQSGGHKARDAQGTEININSTDWTTIPTVFACRLAPGQFLEVVAAGIGVGANKDDEDWRDARTNFRVGSWIEAKAGDEVTFLPDALDCDGREAPQPEGEGEQVAPQSWWLKFITDRLSLDAPLPAAADERGRLLNRAAHDLFGNAPTEEELTAFKNDATPTALDTLAKRLAQRYGCESFSGSLNSGPTKFKVLPVDPDAAKKPRTAKNPGQYNLGNATFVVTRRPIGERIVNEAHLAFSSTDATKPTPRGPHEIKLPDDYDSWIAAWMRGGTVLWVAQKGADQKDSIRRYDLTNPASVKETVITELKPSESLPQAVLDVLAPRVQAELENKQGGLDFLKPYPKLHGLSLDMTEPQFLEIVKQQELKTRKTVDGEKVTHHIALGDGHTLIVMFDKDAKCSGIQRVRGEDDVPARPKAVLGRESFKGRVMIDGPIPRLPPTKVQPGLMLVIPRNDEDERRNEKATRETPVVEIPDDSLVISQEGGLANVAIYLKKAPANWKPSAPPETPVELRSKDHRFQPRLSFVRVGQPIRLIAPKNEADNFLVIPLRSNTFNILVPSDSQQDVAQPFTKSESFPIEVKSNLHPWQKAFLLAFDHPFAAITEADGRFEIRDLPAGEHHFTVWHERRGYLNKDLVVRVADGKVTAVDLKYTVEQLSPGDVAPPIQKPDAKPNAGAGRGSPDPALDPTAGLPNSDEETNSTNNANGGLRSKPAAGSGDPRRTPFVAELPAGLKVELVGITKNTRPANAGWRPDGGAIGDVGHWPATNVLHDKNSSTSFAENEPHPEPDADAIDLLVRFEGLKAQPSLALDLPGNMSGFAHRPLQEPHRLRVWTRVRDESKSPDAQFDRPADEVRIGLTDEPWGTWQQISATGEVLNQLGERDRYRSSYSLIQIQGAGLTQNVPPRAVLVFHQPRRHSHLYAFEMRGIDTDGKEHRVSETRNRNVDNTELEETEWGVSNSFRAEKQLARFEYRLRPYRHWVTFENVSLAPGKESDVKVKVETLPSEPEKPNAKGADGPADGLGTAERALNAELSYYGGFSPFRLKGFPQAGDGGRSVRMLEPLVSHLSKDVQAAAGRQFNEALQSIAAAVPTRVEESVDRIINNSGNLPAAYRSALMLNLWIYTNDLKATDGLQKLWGLDAVLLDRVLGKCIFAGLEQAEEIPDGLTLRFLELLPSSLPSLNTDDNANWPAKRHAMASLWLTRIKKIRAAIDPDWNPKDVPMLNIEAPDWLPSGASQKGLRDPKLLAEYEARLEANRRKAEKYNQQLLFRRLLAALSPQMEEDLVRYYVRKPFRPDELKLLLDRHAADTSQRDRVAKSVRLVNAILPNGTQLKYGWPDTLAEAEPAGVPTLIAAVRDKTYPDFIRYDGAWALGVIGDPRALDTLAAVAEDDATPAKYKDIAREFVRAIKEKATPGVDGSSSKPTVPLSADDIRTSSPKPALVIPEEKPHSPQAEPSPSGGATRPESSKGVGAKDGDKTSTPFAKPQGVPPNRNGLDFLKPYPKLQGLSLDMTEPQFLEIVEQQELKSHKTVEGEKVTHHIALGDGHTLIVMFDKDAKCGGIQRVRGEDGAEEKPSAPAQQAPQKPKGGEELPGRLYVNAGLRTTKDEKRFSESAISIDPNTGNWTRLQNLSESGFTVPLSPVRVSPDGRTMLFTRKDELWKCDAMTGDRAKRMLEKGAPAAWSPDGKTFIAVVQTNERDGQLVENWIVNADGQKQSVLALPKGDAVEDWSADGQWLAVRSRLESRIYLVKPDGSGRRRLADSIGYTMGRTGFSPNGQCIVYLTHQEVDDKSRYSLRTINVDGTGDREILGETKAGSKTDSDRWTAPMAARWSPDGKHLAVVLFDHSRDGGITAINGNWRLVLIDPDGGNLRELKLDGVLTSVLPWDGPDWRPTPPRPISAVEPNRANNADRKDSGGTPELRVLRKPAVLLPDHWIVQAVGFDNEGKELVTASNQSFITIRRWDVVGMKLISEIKLQADKHGRAVRDGTLMFSGDRRRVVAATDAYVGIWETATGKLLKQLPFKTKEGIYTCAIDMLDCTPDLSVIVGHRALPGRLTLSYDAHVFVWDGLSGNVLQTVIDKGATDLKAIDLSTDGKRLVTTNAGGAKIWETSTGQLLRSIPNDNTGRKHSEPDVSSQYTSHVWSVQFSPDGQQLAMGDILGVKLLDTTSGKLLQQLEGPYRYSSSGSPGLVFSKDGQWLARLGTQEKVERDKHRYVVPIWSTRTGARHFELHTEANDAAFSDDGQRLAVAFSDMQQALSVWSLSGEASDPEKTAGPGPHARQNRVEENGHYVGKKAAEFIEQFKPVWGNEKLGLQYGIALTKPQRKFRSGERVPLVVFFRNASDKPIKFETAPDFFGNTPKVLNAKGEPITLENIPLLGHIPHYHEKLEPGQALGPFYLSFGLGENPRPGQQHWQPYFKTPVAGPYKLTHSASINVAGPKDGEPSKRDDVTSGTIEIEIVDTPKIGEAIQTILRPQSELENERQLGTLSGRFVYDGVPPVPEELYSLILNEPAPLAPGQRASGVAMTYRHFLELKIRPSTTDASLLVGKDGGIANVIVWVVSKDIPWTPPQDGLKAATIRVKDGNYSPRITAVTVGQPLHLENHDPISFNFHLSAVRNDALNMMLHAASINHPQRVTFRMSEKLPVMFRSDQAIWATGLLLIRDNPFVAISQPDGSFSIPNLPPGEWEFRAWHERKGYVQHWPKGLFNHAIKPGDNSLGTIKLKPALLDKKD